MKNNKLIPSTENHEIKVAQATGKEIDEMPSVFLAIPNMGTVHTDLMLRTITWIYGAKIILFPPQNFSPVSAARNVCVKEFLKQDFDYLFFVDADTVPPADAVIKLLKAKKKVISGVTCNLKLCEDGLLRPAPMVFRKRKEDSWEDGMNSVLQATGIEEVDAFGMSCCMIHKSAFKDMKEPWFTEKFVVPEGEKAMGEDFIFCKKLKESGIKLYADMSIHCDHHKQVKISYPNQLEVARHDVLGNKVLDTKDQQ